METADIVVLVLYFAAVTSFGFLSGRATKSTHDFFFAGQRYGWFLIAMSCIATVVGSYSFVKYAGLAYEFGVAGTQNYLNDFMWVGLFIGAWLPLLWASGVYSVPEYFHRRFGPAVRHAVTALLLLYMVGYIGINFRTLGAVMHVLQPLGDSAWSSQMWWTVIVAVLCAAYGTSGGQVSVIATDLVQGGLLLVAGAAVVWLGVDALADHGGFWSNFPKGHAAAFTDATKPSNAAAIGLFWQDGVANTAAFLFVNQGLMMRFLSAKNQAEGRKAIVAVVLILMPLAAFAVCGGGWVARAMVDAGILEHIPKRDEVFIIVTRELTRPGVFGLIMAALVAALMSTADTLINATAAVFVNDIYRPYVRPQASDKHHLSAARWASIVTAGIGIALVPIFMGFSNIFDAHGMFTASITPPLVVALMMGILWKGYTPAGALATLVGGVLLIGLSMKMPEIIAPFSHGIEPGGEGPKAYKYIRALFGLACCGALGVIVSLFTKRRTDEQLANLVVGEIRPTT